MCAAKRMGADRAQGGDFMISSVLRDCAVVSHNSLLKLEYLSTIATCTCLKRLAELFSCSIANFWELMSRKWEDAFWQWKVVAKMELRLPCILLWRLELEDSVRKRQQEQKTDRSASLSEGVGGNYGVGLDMVMWHMCVSEVMLSLYGGFCTEKMIRIFSVLFLKELVSFESISGVESEYPVNPVQPLGHFGCRAAWKSGMAEKPVKRSVTAGETGCLCSSSLPSAICTV